MNVQQRINTAVTVVLLVAVAAIGLTIMRGRLVENVYKERLRELSEEYESLRNHYNEAVKKTAVTELRVASGKLSVEIVTAAGLLETIDTPYDPSQEIHVDYVVLDGRLWIRRVHDAATPAAQALLIDPRLADVEWDAEGKNYGLTIYRPLTEGRWVVNATSNGALTLVKAETGEEVKLAAAPPIRDYEQIASEIDGDLSEIGVFDLLWASAPTRSSANGR